MKKFLLCLFSFLFVGTAFAGSAFLLAGCNQSYLQEENNNENDNSGEEIDEPDEDEEISAQGYRLDAYIMSFNETYPTGRNNTNGGTVETWSNSGPFWTWAQNGTGVGTAHSYFTNRDWGEVVTQIAYSSGYRLRGYYSTSACTGTDMTSQFTGNDSYDGDDSNTKVSTGHFKLSSARSIYVKSARKVKMNFSTSWGGFRVPGTYGPTSATSFSISGYFGDTTRTYCSASPRAGYTFQWINTNGNKVVSTNNTGFFGIESNAAQNFLRGTSTYGNATSDGSNGVVYNFKTQYTPITYYVKFNGNGATSGSMSNQTFTYDQGQNLKVNAFSKSGYNFSGWATSSTGSVQYSGGQYVSNLTTTSGGTVNLYAVWSPKTFTNTYYYRNNAGYQASSNQSRSYNASFTTYSSTAVTYYNENGWSLYGWLFNDSNGTGRTYAPSTTVTNTTYTQSQSTLGWYAVSSRIITISYNANGGSFSGSSTTGTQYWNQYGNKVTSVNLKVTSTVPTRTGYTFKGWSSYSGATSVDYNSNDTYIYDEGYSISQNVTLYAVWQVNQYDNVYRYRNNSGGQAESVQKRTYNQAFTTLSSSALSYYTSNGWNLYGWLYNDQNGTSRTFAPSASVSTSTYLNSTSTLYWYATSSRTVTLSYNANGGSYSGGSTTGTQYWNQYGNKVTSVSLKVTSTVPTRTGYTFKGWATTSGATSAGYASGATYTFNAGYSSSQNVTLYAVWTPISYLITYDENGGNTISDLNYNIESSSTLASTTRTGYTFNGWKPKTSVGNWSSGTIYKSGESVKGKYGNVELVAQWTVNSYKVRIYAMTGIDDITKPATSWYSDNVGRYKEVSVNYGTNYTISVTTKAVYKFDRWTTTNDSTASAVGTSNSYTFTVEAQNHTFYAWGTPNNPAYYDEEGGYYYVEMGKYPQSSIIDSDLRNWTEYYGSNYSNMSYNETTQMTTFTLTTVGVWEILAIEIPSPIISNGKTYTLTFDYVIQSDYIELSEETANPSFTDKDQFQGYNGLAVQIISNGGISNSPCTDRDYLTYRLPTTAGSGRVSTNFANLNEGSTMWVAINGGYVNDGQTVTFSLGNFRLLTNEESDQSSTGNKYEITTKQLENNMLKWTEYYSYDQIEVKYDSSNAKNELTISTIDGWEIIGRQIYVEKNQDYTISFNFEIADETNMNGSLRLQVLNTFPENNNNEGKQVAYLDLNSNGNISLTFNSGENSTLYVIFNGGYLGDGSKFVFNISNISLKHSGKDVYYTLSYDSYTLQNREEYLRYNNTWYKVEPIKWRLTGNSSQKVGYGTTTDTMAIMDTIVYAGQFATSSLGIDQGYDNRVTTNFENVVKNAENSTYLVSYSPKVESFGTSGVTTQTATDKIFISSEEEIQQVAGSYEVKFSDLVKDILGITIYFTRDMGTNINNITCRTEYGGLTQKFATSVQGFQFTIKVSEYGCVS